MYNMYNKKNIKTHLFGLKTDGEKRGNTNEKNGQKRSC